MTSTFRPLRRWALPALATACVFVSPSCKSDDAAGDRPAANEEGPGAGGQVSSGSGASGGETLGSGGMGGGSGGATPGLMLPSSLSETGLYESDMETLAPGVRPFRPQFPLWTDGAEKARWILLPEGASIDTSDMDYWQLPIGTKLWKEFAVEGVRVETRLLMRQPTGVWMMVAYQWRDDFSDADAVPAGVMNASGTSHDIPSEEQCWQCHNQMPGRVIGFSAVQLAHDAGQGLGGAPAADEWTLQELVSSGFLTQTPPAVVVPGTDVERDALGYLHANCGHCHHPRSGVFARVDMQLWLTVGDLSTVQETPTFLTTVSVDSALIGEGPPGATKRVAPSDLAASSVYARVITQGENYSMPPIGTEVVSPTGQSTLEAWIASLAPPIE